MLLLTLALVLATNTVSPYPGLNPGEGRVAIDSRPSTSSGLTDEGKAQSPLDAERAFAADAQRLGQWTAFAKWAADDAVMFVPQAVNAHAWLKDRANPAKAAEWWPIASYVSCDGSLAVNTGNWKRPDGSIGYFSTVWQRQKDGDWKWIVDSGGALKSAPKRSLPKVVRATCDAARTSKLQREDEQRDAASTAAATGERREWPTLGFSKDYSLSFFYIAQLGDPFFSANYWNGHKLVTAVRNSGSKSRR